MKLKDLTQTTFSGDEVALISCMPISAKRFTQKWDCFQNNSDIFYFLGILKKQVKTSGRMLIIDWIINILSIFSWSKIFRAILTLFPNKIFSRTRLCSEVLRKAFLFISAIN